MIILGRDDRLLRVSTKEYCAVNCWQSKKEEFFLRASEKRNKEKEFIGVKGEDREKERVVS